MAHDFPGEPERDRSVRSEEEKAEGDLTALSKSEWECAEKTEAPFTQRCTMNIEKQLTRAAM